jgi:hypothetical protein
MIRATIATRKNLGTVPDVQRKRGLIEAAPASRVWWALLASVILLSALPELRLTPYGLVFTTIAYTVDVQGVGYPRLCEIVAICLCAFSLPRIGQAIRSNQRRRWLIFAASGFVVAASGVTLLNDAGGWDRVRSGIALPFGVFVSVLSARLNEVGAVRLIRILLVVGLLSAAVVIVQPWIPDFMPRLSNYDASDSYRYWGFGQAPAYQGAYLLMYTALCVALASQEHRFGLLAIYFSLLALFFVAIMMTGTRMSLLVFVVVVGLGLWKTIMRIGLVVILGATLIACGLLLAPGNQVAVNMSGFLERLKTADIERVAPWTVAAKILIAHPIDGIGDYETAVTRMSIETPAHPQNMALGLALFGGLPLAALYLIIVFAIWQINLEKVQARPSNTIQLSAAVLLVIIVYLLTGMTEVIDCSVQVQLLFFTICGASIALDETRWIRGIR